jgi:flavocytochrome c
MFEDAEPVADALIVGTGLAGLTTALRILDRGGTVIIYEKEGQVGGNSNKASSGINACCFREEQQINNDTLALFRQDTVSSAGDVADLDLIDTLVDNSKAAIRWLHERVGVDLSVLVQLGGHSRQRTHRPREGFVGAEIIAAIHEKIRQYEVSGRATIQTSTQVTRIITSSKTENDDGDDDGGDRNERILGIVTESLDGHYGHIRADHVVLATGGFASDRSPQSLLAKYRPDLTAFAATAGSFSTGDGIVLAEQVGATTRDMTKVQLHPTGFVDPSDPSNPNKVLAAELLRGYGGILLTSSGQRFCNELGTRSYVTDRMLHHTQKKSFHPFRASSSSSSHQQVPTFFLVLSSEAAEDAHKHVQVYERKGLLKKVHGLEGLAEYIKTPTSTLEETVTTYQSASRRGVDEFGKTSFRGAPGISDDVFYVGIVTPVLHYCMGGIRIDNSGNVLGRSDTPIEGLYAAGEVTGGVHGNNRLGGNSLLECAVFGSIIGENLPIDQSLSSRLADSQQNEDKVAKGPIPIISMEQVAQHNLQDDCWVAIHGKVFDLTKFADQHPGGVRSIQQLCGVQGTQAFSLAHGEHILSNLRHLEVGVLKQDKLSDQKNKEDADAPIDTLASLSLEELLAHKKDTWVALHGVIYDLSEFASTHPGGDFIIRKLSGTDATEQYSVFHPQQKLDAIRHLAIGRLSPSADVERSLKQ